jgi:hypothetical protein
LLVLVVVSAISLFAETPVLKGVLMGNVHMPARDKLVELVCLVGGLPDEGCKFKSQGD